MISSMVIFCWDSALQKSSVFSYFCSISKWGKNIKMIEFALHHITWFFPALIYRGSRTRCGVNSHSSVGLPRLETHSQPHTSWEESGPFMSACLSLYPWVPGQRLGAGCSVQPCFRSSWEEGNVFASFNYLSLNLSRSLFPFILSVSWRATSALTKAHGLGLGFLFPLQRSKAA